MKRILNEFKREADNLNEEIIDMIVKIAQLKRSEPTMKPKEAKIERAILNACLENIQKRYAYILMRALREIETT